MSVEIRAITTADDNWDEFVFQHPRGSIYHHSSWLQLLQLTYGYQPVYLVLQDSVSKQIEGLAPFMLVSSGITGNRIVSLPFSSFCELLLPEWAVADVIDFARGQYRDIKYLEIKLTDADHQLPPYLLKQSSYLTHLADLSVGEDLLLKSFHATSVRQRILRAARDDRLKFQSAQSEADLRNFFRLHTASRKKHGLPPPPYDFFANMWRLMAPKGLMTVPFIVYEGEMICAAVVLKYKDTISFEYSASDESYLHLSGNQMLTWEVMRRACGEGFKTFDFGRSSLDNQSLIEYKDRWAAKRVPLNYYYYPNTRTYGAEGSMGRRLLNRANRLLPGTLLQLEGKYLYRHLG